MKELDIVGIGAGPSNLSTAALLSGVPELSCRFVERRSSPAWHPGLMLPEATVQVSFLKDLVTLVEPRNAYSFLCFLAAHDRIYRFVIADRPRVSRREFAEYLAWVARRLPCVGFGEEVLEVRCDGDRLSVRTSAETYRCKNLILGTGQAPNVPACFRGARSPDVFHSNEFLSHATSFEGIDVAVVGGGQSSAEIMSHLLAGPLLPRRIHWISRRGNFAPLDESPFTNELFTPSYSEYFFGLPEAARNRLLADQKLASDGVSSELLRTIYQRLYELQCVEKRDRIAALHPACEVVGFESHPRGGHVLSLQQNAHRGPRQIRVDKVLLATGYRYELPSFLDELRERIRLRGDEPEVRTDFSLQWDGPPHLRIYGHNLARRSRGIADPNLSLLAWRSAKIINSIAGTAIFPLREGDTLLEWHHAVEPRRPEIEDLPHDLDNTEVQRA